MEVRVKEADEKEQEWRSVVEEKTKASFCYGNQ